MTTTETPHTDQTEPRADRSRRRRRWVAAVSGVVVLVAGAIAGSFAVRGGDGDAPPVSAPPKLPPGAIRADVDGDGRADVVQLTRTDLLKVSLASGRTATQLLQDRPRIEGVADVGGVGLAVVTSKRAEGGREWQARVLRGRRLVVLHVRHRGVIGIDHSADQTAWLSGGRLYDGTFDDLQSGADHVAVLARSWSLENSELASTRAGVRCWDRTSDHTPATCAPGQDWTYDVGPHGDLPALLPSVFPSWASVKHASFGGQTWSLRKVGSRGGPEFAPYDVLHSADGVVHSARVAQGWGPSLFPSPVRLDHGTSGLLLSQEGGDSDTWRVYVDRGGRVQELDQEGPLPLGGGFTHDGDHTVYSWLTPGGRLYTRVGLDQPAHFHVYAWQPTGGDATTPPTLVAHDLGTVCIDDMWNTYGTCTP
jgi:hypothetical protein